jgi:hypothetical protein
VNHSSLEQSHRHLNIHGGEREGLVFEVQFKNFHVNTSENLIPNVEFISVTKVPSMCMLPAMSNILS